MGKQVVRADKLNKMQPFELSVNKRKIEKNMRITNMVKIRLTVCVCRLIRYGWFFLSFYFGMNQKSDNYVMVSVTERANEKRKIKHLCAGRLAANLRLTSPLARSWRQF